MTTGKWRFSDPYPLDWGGIDWTPLLKATNEGYYARVPMELRPEEYRYKIDMSDMPRVNFLPVPGMESPFAKPSSSNAAAERGCPHDASPLRRLYGDVAVCMACGQQFRVQDFTP